MAINRKLPASYVTKLTQIGTAAEDAATGAVGTTKTLSAYIKQLVTYVLTLGTQAENAATGAVGTTKSLFAYVKQLVTNQLAYQVTNAAVDATLEKCVEKSDGAVLSGDDVIFNITGGPIKILEIVGFVTTEIGAGTTNVKLQIDTTTPSATIDMSAAAVDIDGDVAGTSYQTINTTGVFTPVTAGYVKEANAFAVQPTQFLAPIGDIVFNSSAARTGNIKWYMRYKPLSPNSVVTAAA